MRKNSAVEPVKSYISLSPKKRDIKGMDKIINPKTSVNKTKACNEGNFNDLLEALVKDLSHKEARNEVSTSTMPTTSPSTTVQTPGQPH